MNVHIVVATNSVLQMQVVVFNNRGVARRYAKNLEESTSLSVVLFEDQETITSNRIPLKLLPMSMWSSEAEDLARA